MLCISPSNPHVTPNIKGLRIGFAGSSTLVLIHSLLHCVQTTESFIEPE